jgi:2'-5' RNA ligase
MAILRTFIAVTIEPTPELRAVLADLSELAPTVRPVAADKLHVTLKFLGDTDENLIPQVAEIVRKAAQERPAIEVRLTGLGAFPHAARPAVVWVGLQGADLFIELAAELDSQLGLLGFLRESRPFQPHLTLARIKAKPPRELGAYLAQHGTTPFGTAWIRSVDLFHSNLERTGARYTVLASAPLAVP